MANPIGQNKPKEGFGLPMFCTGQSGSCYQNTNSTTSGSLDIGEVLGQKRLTKGSRFRQPINRQAVWRPN